MVSRFDALSFPERSRYIAIFKPLRLLPGFGDSGRFRYKEHYHLLTRLAYCQCLMRQVFMGVLNEFEWTDISLIVDRSDLSARVLGESLDEGFQNGGIYPNIVTYYSHEKYDRAALLQEASNKTRGQSPARLSLTTISFKTRK